MQPFTTALKSHGMSLAVFSAWEPLVSHLSRSASSGLWLGSMSRRPAVGDSAQPLPSEASAQPVWLSHSGLSFHILDVGASLCPWGQQGLSHSCLLQSTQQLSPAFPRGNHRSVLVLLLPGCSRVPAGWCWEQSCHLFWACRPLDHQAMIKMGPKPASVSRLLVRKRRRRLQSAGDSSCCLALTWFQSRSVGRNLVGTWDKEEGIRISKGRAAQPQVLGLCSWATAATAFAASSFPAWWALCPPVASVRQGPGPQSRGGTAP